MMKTMILSRKWKHSEQTSVEDKDMR